MNKKIILLIIGLAFLGIGIFVGRITIDASKEVSAYIPDMKIIGDVNEVIGINNFKSNESDENKYFEKAIPLIELVEMAEPVVEEYDVLLVGEDGLFAQLKGENLDDCSIKFSQDNGWESITENHPINSRIKRIKEIVVVSRENTWDYGLNIINSRENVLNITPGQFYLKETTLYPYLDGKSSKKAGGKDYDVRLYKQKKLLSIKDVTGEDKKNLLMMGENGAYEILSNEGYLELMGNKINYVVPNDRIQIQGIKGIMMDMPPDSIMNTYYDALHYIENDDDVMIVFLDGFAYRQYAYAISKNYIPFLETLDKPKMATSVYKPVTNAGFAAMITGKPPHINGVYDRSYKDLKTESIFGAVKNMGKKAVLVEGDIKILNTEIEPILNIDKNENGTRDDEIFNSALEEIKKDPNLILVHFHSIDDMGHEHGDLAKETMETINTIDGYVNKLAASWKGKIIITADHGMHKTSDGGEHGMFRYEDLIVPYFVLEGGA